MTRITCQDDGSITLDQLVVCPDPADSIIRVGATAEWWHLKMLKDGTIKSAMEKLASIAHAPDECEISTAVFGEGAFFGRRYITVQFLCTSSGTRAGKFFIDEYFHFGSPQYHRCLGVTSQLATTLAYVHGDDVGYPEQQLFVGWQDGTSCIWKIGSSDLITYLQETPAPKITKTAHRHGSNWFVVAREDGSVKIFDRRTWEPVMFVQPDGNVGKNFVTMYKTADGTEGVLNVRQVKKEGGGWRTTMNEITDFDQTALVAYAGQRNVASKLLNRQIR